MTIPIVKGGCENEWSSGFIKELDVPKTLFKNNKKKEILTFIVPSFP